MRQGFNADYGYSEPMRTSSSEDGMGRRGFLGEAMKKLGAAALGVAGIYAGVHFTEREVHRQRLERVKDQTAFAHAYWDTFEDIGADVVSTNPDMEQTLQGIRWRELSEPSIFHTVGDIMYKRYQQDLHTEAAGDTDNMFAQAIVDGNPTAFKTYLRALVDTELEHAERYKDTPGTVVEVAGIPIDEEQPIYPSRKPRGTSSHASTVTQLAR